VNAVDVILAAICVMLMSAPFVLLFGWGDDE